MQAYNTETGQIETLDSFVLQNTSNPRFVVGIPHCGLHLPTNFPRQFNLYGTIVNDSDLGSRELFDLTEVGGVVASVNLHRNAIDLNRLGLDGPFKRKNKKTGQEKYPAPDLTDEEKKKLFGDFYVPFYRKIKETLFSLREIHENAVLISGHTFNLGKGKVDICIGGGVDKKLCSLDFKYALAKNLEKTLTNAGLYRNGIGMNCPFNGKDGISGQFGNPEKGVHTLLVEFNRELFIDCYEEPTKPYTSRSVDPRRITVLRRCLEEAMDVSLRDVFGI